MGSMEDNLNILINQGKEYLKTGKDDLALDVFYESLDIARDVRDQNNEAEILHRIAMIYNKKGDYENEIKFLTDSIKVFKQLQRNIDVLRGLMCVQYYYINQDNKSRAIKGLKHCQRLSRTIPDSQIRSEIVRDISYGYYNLGKYKKALMTFINAVEIDKSVEIDCLIGMGKSYHELGKYEEAEKYLQQALELAQSKEQYELELEALENLAMHYTESYQYENILACLNNISEKEISPTLKFRTLNNIGTELMILLI